MNSQSWFWPVFTGIIYLAILYALVQPSSPAATAVTAISSALTTLVSSATGNTTPGNQSTGLPSGSTRVVS